jgi:Type I phosphodiesterase / nucleotide pyrophosphatase
VNVGVTDRPEPERSERDLSVRVDEARQRLRDLGYLANPLDSFVAGRRPRGGTLVALVGIAARLGLVGGALVSLLVWLATLGINPAILDDPRDLAILAAYLFAVYFIAIFTVGLVTGGALLAAARARTRRSAPHPRLFFAIGAFATTLTLLYGTLWWRWNRFAVGTDGFGSAVNILAGILIVLVALLLGRLARLSAILLVEAERSPRFTSARRGRGDTIGTLAIGVTASALFFAYLYATAPRAQGAALDASPFEVAQPVRPMLVIGIDGLSWTDFVYLAKQGDLPNLARLLESAARAPLKGAPLGEPPELWTTIATGVSAGRHGVNAFVLSRPAGMRAGVSMPDSPFGLFPPMSTVLPQVGLSHEVPVSGLTRRKKAVWEILAEKSVATGVVNWWATWPAEASAGIVVSERAFARLSNNPDGVEEIEHMLAPLSLAPAANTLARQAVDAIAPEAGGLPPHLVAAGRLAQAGDLFTIGMAERLLADQGGHGLVALYLPGLDILRRPLVGDGARAGLPALDTRIQTIRMHGRALDEGVGRLTRDLPAGACIALIMSPGERGAVSVEEEGGLFALIGPPARAEYRAAAIRPEEIAPTILVCLGFPASLEMDGRPRTDFLMEDVLRARPIVEIESFGDREIPDIADTKYDEEFLERLRSLGYIE